MTATRWQRSTSSLIAENQSNWEKVRVSDSYVK